ncbi:MAG: hypothetical protein P4L81_06730 [Candidatus Pacebacteria bacterium]|nr:hypothetical protein [Candidatus Paceibacterota bacterium]
MEPQTNEQLLREIYRLTKENNEMAHRARRSAFFWGFVKFIIYAALLIAPIWFYMTYLNGAVEEMLKTMQQFEAVNPQAQGQFQGIQNALNQLQQLEARFGAASSTPTH